MSPWPVALRGVTESVVSTQGPDGAWNVAALGIHAPDGGPATARTWGRTRTRRNFDHRESGVVQFTRDPLLFVRAALDVYELAEPVCEEKVDAWARVDVERLKSGSEGGTEWVDWSLDPVESAVLTERVGRFERGPAAVVEATVAASRLDVPAYDTERLRERIAYFGDVAEKCGDERTQDAFELLCDLADVDHC